ncbi:transcription antitermination factor NusB [Candidatus Sumerlaeota bacterium]|nr:transcription antitermination factor NusB [Candidatus Sumerlaeota bacterium]
MGERRRARERAVQILYAIDRTGQSLTDALLAYVELQRDRQRPSLHHFTVELLERTLEHVAEIDRVLADVIAHWQPQRVALVDRQILRLAACELTHFPDVPPKVTLNEYIEIAKVFGGQEAAAFVNGVLDKVAHLASGELEAGSQKLEVRGQRSEVRS